MENTINNNTSSPGSSNPRRLLLVSVPRTASNLLLKVLDIHRQPNVLTNDGGGYFFYKAYMVAARDVGKPADQWTDDQKTQIRDLYQECLDQLEEYSARAKADNKIMFAKEHAFWLVNPLGVRAQSGAEGSGVVDFRLRFPDAYGPGETFSEHNETLFPDEYLRTWQIAFIIRHPALAFPSLYRAMQKMTKLGFLDEDGVKGASMANMSLTWTRKLFDWSLAQSGGKTVPLVLDAHDIIHHPESVLRFCEGAGLDKDAVQFEWNWEEKEAKPHMSGSEADQQAARIMLSTLEASKGIVKDKAPATVDIKAEADKWKEEFGEEIAGLIEGAVVAAMPDYEYLREKRVQA